MAGLRARLQQRYLSQYGSVHVVGVAVNTSLKEGREYLESIGVDAFDEVSVGSGWQNEHLIRLVWRDHATDAAAPVVIVLARQMSATLAPLKISFGADTVLRVVKGSSRIEKWIQEGAPITDEKLEGQKSK